MFFLKIPVLYFIQKQQYSFIFLTSLRILWYTYCEPVFTAGLGKVKRKDRYTMKNSGIMKFTTSLIYILFGLALMIWPQKVENVICVLLAACVIIFGIAKILGYAVIKVETRIAEDTNGFAIGVSLIILGIFLWLKGTMIIALIPFILGFMITYKGLEGIQNVINFKKFGYGTSKGVLIASVVIALFGIIVMMNPFSTAKVLFFMLGLGLFVSGLSDFISDVFFTRQLKKLEDAKPEQK